MDTILFILGVLGFVIGLVVLGIISYFIFVGVKAFIEYLNS